MYDASPLIFCAIHGVKKLQGIASVDSTSTIEYIDSSAQCPVCGRDAQVFNGKYEGTKSGLDILLSPSISPQALSALKQIFEKLQKEEISSEKAKAEAEAIFLGAGRLFDIADWGDGAKATLYASIIGAIALVTAAKISKPESFSQQPASIERSMEDLKGTVTSPPRIPTPKWRPK